MGMIHVRVTLGGDVPSWDGESAWNWWDCATCGGGGLAWLGFIAGEPWIRVKRTHGGRYRFSHPTTTRGAWESPTTQTMQAHERSLMQQEFQGFIYIFQQLDTYT